MKIAVLGAGLMGRAALYDLVQNPQVDQAAIYDIDSDLASEMARQFGDEKTVSGAIDAGDEDAVAKLLTDYDSAISCVTYKYNPTLTAAAIRAGCHLVDLGGNNDVVRIQQALDKEAEEASVIIIPDCGLAPGFVSILVADGMNRLDTVSSVKIRVGGLPQSPRPPLNYQLLFSTEGLINEYWETCNILSGGQLKMVNPMSGLESLNFDGIGELEAFYTSGGTSTLVDSYQDRIEFLDYKTIRYPGHCQALKPMLEIGLASRQPVMIGGSEVIPRELFKGVLEKSLTRTSPDMTLVRVSFEGSNSGEPKSLVYEIVDRQESSSPLTSMMRMTAFPAAIVAFMAASGQISKRGVKPQEVCVDPSGFIPLLKKRDIRLVTSGF